MLWSGHHLLGVPPPKKDGGRQIWQQSQGFSIRPTIEKPDVILQCVIHPSRKYEGYRYSVASNTNDGEEPINDMIRKAQRPERDLLLLASVPRLRSS